MFNKILNLLSGYKTYIIAVLIGIFNFGVAVGWWTPDSQLWTTLNVILGAFGLGFLRAAVSK